MTWGRFKSKTPRLAKHKQTKINKKRHREHCQGQLLYAHETTASPPLPTPHKKKDTCCYAAPAPALSPSVPPADLTVGTPSTCRAHTSAHTCCKL